MSIGVGGLLIGFYKAKSDFAEAYISKGDCARCAVRIDVTHLIAQVKEAENFKNSLDSLQKLLVTQTKVMKDIESINTALVKLAKDD
jgi:hypothetical protein